MIVQGINGLRALAVLAVMLHHTSAPLTDAGWLGVDLFFVLSGFLITTLLMREHDRSGQISLSAFWARRFLRLMPIYVVYVGAVTALILLTPDAARESPDGFTTTNLIASLWTYTVNYLPIGGIWEHQSVTSHLWSLAVEEQFYFVWPLVLIILARHRHVALMCWLIVGCGLLANSLVYTEAPSIARLETRGVGLVIGCAIAATLHNHRAFLERLGLLRPTAGPIAALLALIVFAVATAYCITSDEPRHPGCYLLGDVVPIFGLLVGVLIMHLWDQPDSAMARALSWAPLAFLGKISYGMYLYHMAVHAIVWDWLTVDLEHWHRVPKFGTRVVIFTGLTIAVSWLSYRALELPFLHIKDRIRGRNQQPSSTLVAAPASELVLASKG